MEINGHILVAVSILSLISSFGIAVACGLFFMRLDRGAPFEIAMVPIGNDTTDVYRFNRTFVNPVELAYDGTCFGKNFYHLGTFMRHEIGN